MSHSQKKLPAAPPPEAVHRELGSRVRRLRTARGWSLEALAAASGVSRSMLSQIEREQACEHDRAQAETYARRRPQTEHAQRPQHA